MMSGTKAEKLDWFNVAVKLKSISQAGKFFAKDEYELKRHLEIEELAANILAGCTGTETQHVLSAFQQDTGYPTPKVDCRGVVFRDGKILLVREIEDGGWTLPGGWCDVGMTPSENVVREVLEESGFETKAVRLLAVFDRDKQGHKPPYPFSIFKMFFMCEIICGEATISNETSEVAFFARNQIPNLSMGRTLPHQIERFYEQAADASSQCEFD